MIRTQILKYCNSSISDKIGECLQVVANTLALKSDINHTRTGGHNGNQDVVQRHFSVIGEN